MRHGRSHTDTIRIKDFSTFWFLTLFCFGPNISRILIYGLCRFLRICLTHFQIVLVLKFKTRKRIISGNSTWCPIKGVRSHSIGISFVQLISIKTPRHCFCRSWEISCNGPITIKPTDIYRLPADEARQDVCEAEPFYSFHIWHISMYALALRDAISRLMQKIGAFDCRLFLPFDRLNNNKNVVTVNPTLDHTQANPISTFPF